MRYANVSGVVSTAVDSAAEMEYTIKAKDRTGGFDDLKDPDPIELHIRDKRPQWQKLNDRKSRSRPNPKRSR